MRLISTVLTIVMLSLCLTACSSDGSDVKTRESREENGTKKDDKKDKADTPTPKPPDDDPALTPTDTPVPDDKTVLTMWCIAVPSDSMRHAYESAISDMELRYPDIELRWEAMDYWAYREKLKTALEGNALPDIFYVTGGSFIQELIPSGKLYNMDDLYLQYSDKINEKMFVNATCDGKKYAVPLTMSVVAMFANMDVLKQVGYDSIPETYEELVECCDKLVATGIYPFGCCNNETWCFSEYAESVAQKVIGSAALSDILYGRASWDNPGYAKAIDLIQGWIQKNYMEDTSASEFSNDRIKQDFMDGRYAFYINGSWNAPVFEWCDANIDVGEFPAFGGDKKGLGQMIGGPSDSLAVNADSPNADLAAMYTFELAREICRYGYLDYCGLPTWNIDYDDSNLSPMVRKLAMTVNQKDLVLFGDVALTPSETDIYLTNLREVPIFAIDGNEFIRRMKESVR